MRAGKARHSWVERSTCQKNGWRIACAVGRRVFPMRCVLRGIGELAKQMLLRAFAADVPAQWVAGDTVYGYDELRMWLDEQQKNYVVAVPGAPMAWMHGPQQPGGPLAALFPRDAWVGLFEGAWVQLPEQAEAGRERARWILIRRNLSDPSKRAYYRAAGPATTTLPELVQVAGSRWKIEEGLEEAKGEGGLDQYEARGFRAWYRFVTLALLAHAILVVLRAQANAQEKKAEAAKQVSS